MEKLALIRWPRKKKNEHVYVYLWPEEDYMYRNGLRNFPLQNVYQLISADSNKNSD